MALSSPPKIVSTITNIPTWSFPTPTSPPEEFVQFVIVTLGASAFIEVHRLTKAGGGFDLLINEVEPDDQT